MNCKTKLLALTLASVMTASLAGCGASASAGSATSAEAASATQESAPGGEDGVFTISDQILASEIANGNAAEGDVKIIHESAAIPAEAVVVAEQVDQATRDKLVEFLTSYDNEQYFTDVIKVPGARFVECDMSDYEDIIELNKIINEF